MQSNSGRSVLVVLAALSLFGFACSSSTPETGATTTVAPQVTAVGPSTTTAPTTTLAVPTEVETTSGPVIGEHRDDVISFQAIPYAAAPVGEHRWRAPVAPDPWIEPLLADSQGLACPQNAGITSTFLFTPDQDEDCLTLNVVAPVGADNAPVMVWIHGGGFTSGSAHQPVYEGSNLARDGVVTVAINYRLGPFGFLVTDALTQENGPAGNYGLQDQQFALNWVRDNIALFGGDPDNVTIYGESAGGFSVCAHLALPGSAGLFHRAIIQSGGSCDGAVPLQVATGDGTNYVNATSCAEAVDQLTCLRELPVADLLTAAAEFDIGTPVLDGSFYPSTAFELAEADALSGVPIITGSNLDEMTLFTIGTDLPTDDELAELIGEEIPDFADLAAVVGLYADAPDNLAAYQTFLTDMMFGCGAQDFATAASVSAPVWQYHLTHLSADEPFGLGVTHGTDFVYLFGNPEGVQGLDAEVDDVDQQVGDFMREQWTTFAATGAPTDVWPGHSPLTPNVLDISADPSVFATARNGRCSSLRAAGAFEPEVVLAPEDN